MAELIRLSNSIVSGAQVLYAPNVTRNPSEAGVSGRIALAPIKREYTLTISSKESDEMVAIIMALRGTRYPLTLRDYVNYILEDEEIPHTGEIATIGKTWAPATGDMPEPYFERILVIDQSETPFVVEVNGEAPSPYSFEDYGKINIPGLIDDDVVTVSGHYLMAVCLMDAPSTNIIKNKGGLLHKFADMRFEQIFEPELERLVP